MKVPARVAPAVFAALLCATAARAQDAPAPVKFAPGGEGFAVRMPGEPAPTEERVAAGELKVAGLRYEAVDEGGRHYVVWSLKGPADSDRRFAGVDYRSELFRGESLYLDQIAEVAWQLLVTPEAERAKSRGRSEFPQLAYGREFRLDGKPAREYTLVSKKTAGPVFVCADGPRVYIVAALGADRLDPRLKQFVQSFTLNPDPPAPRAADPRAATGTAGGLVTGGGPSGGPVTGGMGGTGGPVDYNRTFRQQEVTKKAVVTRKPEPGFTEQARRFNVTGVVRVRAVLNKTGEVTNVAVIKGLPHGLTWKAVAAARGIKFEPAQKDGHTVSQYVTIDYNFNIY